MMENVLQNKSHKYEWLVFQNGAVGNKQLQVKEQEMSPRVIT